MLIVSISNSPGHVMAPDSVLIETLEKLLSVSQLLKTPLPARWLTSYSPSLASENLTYSLYFPVTVTDSILGNFMI